MTTFDRIRYAIALLLLLTGPGAVLFWFPILRNACRKA